MKRFIYLIAMSLSLLLVNSSCKCDCMDEIEKNLANEIAVKKKILEDRITAYSNYSFRLILNNEQIALTPGKNIKIENDLVYFSNLTVFRVIDIISISDSHCIYIGN